MKTNLLKSFPATVLLGSMALTAAAEEQAPARLLTEGRSWLYATVSTFNGDTLGYYRIDVMGDTVANNRPCKQLVRYNVDSPESKTFHAVCEDNGYLYFFHRNTASLNPERADSVPLVDFRLKGGEVLDSYDFAHGGFESDPRQLRVGTPDYVEVDGTPRRRLTLKDELLGSTCHWVEGVGASDLLSTLQCSCHSASRDVFVACYENGRRIFTMEDFNKPAVTTAPTQLLVDGKSWLIGTVNYNYSVPGTHHTTLSRIEVKGDTLVGGKACKKLYSYAVNKEADRNVAVAYEEDGRVYGCLGGDDTLFFPMMDFSLKEVGDKAQLHDVSGAIDDYYHISAINRRAVNGKEFRELTVRSDGGQTNSWVEGVGAARDNWLTLFEQPTCMTGVAYSYMIACYQDGECLFTQNDFTVKGRPTPVMPEILNDGKSWIYEEDYHDSDKPERRSTLRFKLEVVGDTVIDGVLCRNLLRTCLNNDEIRQAHIGAFEYEHSVYKVEPSFYQGKPAIAPLMRFNYGQDDLVLLWYIGSDRYLDESSQLRVAEINKLNVRGVERTEYVLKSNNSYDRDRVVNSWVEGIGAATNFWITQWPLVDSPSYAIEYSGRLLECWQGDECIFTSKDFTHPIAGIAEVRTEAAAADGAAYDLQGRRLAKPAPGQLYIRDGRLRRD